MAYINVTDFTVNQIQEYTERKIFDSNPESFLKNQVLKRGVFLVLVPTLLVTSVMDIAIGLFSGIPTLLTAGKKRKILKISIDHLQSAQLLIAGTYMFVLGIINPNAKFPNFNSDFQTYQNDIEKPFINKEGDGFISSFAINYLENVAQRSYRSGYMIKKHLGSRSTYCLLIPTLIVTRVTDLAIGIFAAAFSILTVGKIGSLNNLAYRGLQGPALIYDLLYYTIKSIQPSKNLEQLV